MSRSLKIAGQNLLKRLGLYQRVKASFAYDLYWRFADRTLIAERDAEVAFFRNTLVGLMANDLILDIGANRGHKTDIFLRLGARVIAVDPDESNQEILRQNFSAYRLRKKPVTLVRKAISDRNGTETMWVDEPGSAKNTLNAKWVETLKMDGHRFGHTLEFGHKMEVETITLDELIQLYGRPFYVKIDVEGHEPSVLRGLTNVVPFLSFEVNLPEFELEAKECVDLLYALHPTGTFNYTIDCREMMLGKSWLGRENFLSALSACRDPSIEVFWRA